MGMNLLALSMLLIVGLLCAVVAYQARLAHQQTSAMMRLLSLNFGFSSHSIAEPKLSEPSAPAPPRQVHKLSIPVPRGAMPRPLGSQIGGTSAEAIAQFNAAQRSATPTAKQ